MDGHEEEPTTREIAEALDDEVNPARRFDSLQFAGEVLDAVGNLIEHAAEFVYIPCRHLLAHAKWRRQREQMIRQSRHEIDLLTGGTDG